MNKNTPILEIKNLKAAINTNEILKDLNLTVYSGEIHAIMGPNGSGKSTFSKVLAGRGCMIMLNLQTQCIQSMAVTITLITLAKTT